MPPIQIYYVLFLSKEIADAKARFTNACNGNIEVLRTAEEGQIKTGVVLECQSTSERPVPNSQMLAYFGRGFDAKSAAALGEAKAALSLTGVGPFDAQHKLLRELTSLRESSVKRAECGGFRCRRLAYLYAESVS